LVEVSLQKFMSKLWVVCLVCMLTSNTLHLRKNHLGMNTKIWCLDTLHFGRHFSLLPKRGNSYL